MKVLFRDKSKVVRVEDGLAGNADRERGLAELHGPEVFPPHEQDTASALAHDDREENDQFVRDQPFRNDTKDQ